MTQQLEDHELLLPPITIEEQKFINRNKEKLKKKRRARLTKYIHHIRPKKKNKRSRKIIVEKDSGSIRTRYERIFESYCKLLGQPYIIDGLFCFYCNNYYLFGDHASLPRRCRICLNDFYLPAEKKGCVARPDFILDFNNPEARQQYKHDTHHRRIDNIKLYRDEYMKKVGIVRIDGSVHNTHTQQIKDYHQVNNFTNAGIKVFIVTNEDIERLLAEGDNGKSLLQLCHMIGNAIIDEQLYIQYTQDKDFIERTRKPF